MPKLKTLKVALDLDDFESIQEAVAIRGSGLFRVNGELIITDGDGDMRGRLLAEVCRGWVEMLTKNRVDVARMAARMGQAEEEKGGAA